MVKPMSKLKLWEVLESYEYEPVREMLSIVDDPECTNRLKYEINRTFMEYIYPKQKAVQVTPGEGQKIAFNMDFSGGDKEGTKE